VAKHLLEHGADPKIKNNVSTAACGLAVMVQMVIVGSEGWGGSGSGVLLFDMIMK
jgi:hypothetical protein